MPQQFLQGLSDVKDGVHSDFVIRSFIQNLRNIDSEPKEEAGKEITETTTILKVPRKKTPAEVLVLKEFEDITSKKSQNMSVEGSTQINAVNKPNYSTTPLNLTTHLEDFILPHEPSTQWVTEELSNENEKIVKEDRVEEINSLNKWQESLGSKKSGNQVQMFTIPASTYQLANSIPPPLPTLQSLPLLYYYRYP